MFMLICCVSHIIDFKASCVETFSAVLTVFVFVGADVSPLCFTSPFHFHKVEIIGNLYLARFNSKSFQELGPKSKSKKVKKSITKEKKDKKGRASFKRAGRKFGLAPPNAAADGPDPENKFLGYDLTPLPREAYPDRSRPNQGKLSYTIDFSGARVEVLLEKKAYFIKVVSPGFPGPKGQITWSKFGGPQAAWDIVKERSGFNRTEESAS